MRGKFVKRVILIVGLFLCTTGVFAAVSNGLYAAKMKKEGVEVAALEQKLDTKRIEKSWGRYTLKQRVDVVKKIVENEMEYLGIKKSVRIKLGTENVSERFEVAKAYYDNENKEIILDKQMLSRGKNFEEVLKTILHEMYHVQQNQIMDNRDEYEGSPAWDAIVDIMENESKGIYVQKLVDLKDKYAEYYYSYTEYSARNYAEERGGYYTKDYSDDGYICPAMEYIVWCNSIPVYEDD